MNPVSTLRRLFALLAVLVIALTLGTWLVISLAAQLSDHSERQTAATEFALTLTRLASLVVVPGELNSEVGGIKGDSLAQLLAMGDVQSAALAVDSSQGWFKSPGSVELATGAQEAINGWVSIKSALVDLSTTALKQEGDTVDRLLRPASLDAVSQAFDTVFTVVTNETLSVPLLQVLSEVKAELASLQFLNNLAANKLFVQPFNSSLDRFNHAVDTLQLRVQGQQGGSLIGYESTVALQKFVDKTALLKPVAAAGQADGSELNPLNLSDAQGMIQTAISRNEVTRRALDNAIYQYRRAILGALACLCAALLLAAAVSWRIWYLKGRSRRSKENDLSDLVVQINAIADGNLAVQVQPLAGDGVHARQSRAIADAVNHTESMFRSLVQVSRGVADRTLEVTDRQQQIIEWLSQAQQSENQHLLDQIESMQRSAAELNEHSASQVPEFQDAAASAEKVKNTAVTSNASLAGISSQIELGTSRISRAAEAVGELSIMIERIKTSADKASLKALNTSIQISAYSDGGEPELSPGFIDDVSKVSRKLIASATDAQRLVDGLKSDLQASSLALSSCSESIDESAEGSLNAVQLTGNLLVRLEELSADRQRLTEALASGAHSLSAVATALSSQLESTGAHEQRAELMQTVLEARALAGNFAGSLSGYRLNRDETAGG